MFIRTLPLLPLALLAAAVPAPARAQELRDISVSVTNVKSTKGFIHVELCPKALFLKDCTLVGRAPAQVGTTVVVVRNVPAGRYAAQGYHDVNNNQKVDSNFLGIPKEGIGFSNDAPIGLGPPKFDRAAFDVGGGAPDAISFRLRYLGG